MHESVRLGFVDFSLPFESNLDFFYLDVKAYVTIGLGLLADPLHLVDGVVFKRADGFIATPSEISGAWLRVKNRKDLAESGGEHFDPRKDPYFAQIFATHDSLAALAAKKLDIMEHVVRTHFAGWDEYPEGAQLAIMSMAWSMGPHGFAGFPKFVAACERRDWATAAVECKMSEVRQNLSFRKRNSANRALLEAEVGPETAA